ncbi:MAG: VanW family protein [Anaerotignaceae bacterium]
MNSIAGILVVSMLFSNTTAIGGTANTPSSNQPVSQATENLVVFEQTEEEKQAELEKQKQLEEEAKRIKEEEKRIAEEKAKAASGVVDFNYDIASYTTNYSQSSSNANRNFNMLLASDSINGIIINPGETFSYNDVILSHRTAQRDYLAAGVISDGKIVNAIGGGICQISSTLYNAALYSGMTITTRRNHSLKVGYLPVGRDATASWGSIDFCFRNDLDRPVKIESVMANGVIKIRFLSPGNPNIGDVKIDVTQSDGIYYLKRYVNGVVDYTATSRYKG